MINPSGNSAIDKIVSEARPIAIEFAKKISELSNLNADKYPPQIFASLVGSITLQNILVTIALDTHRPGSETGKKFIQLAFESAKQDALERWDRDDLKMHFNQNPDGSKTL